jgi:hypothetical protein
MRVQKTEAWRLVGPSSPCLGLSRRTSLIRFVSCQLPIATSELPGGVVIPPYGGPHDHAAYLVTMDHIEKLTGLDFLTVLPDNTEHAVARLVAVGLWWQVQAKERSLL